MAEVMPFLMRTYSVRPERRGHALLGISAGGYGAMAIALKHRDLFGSVATLAGPLNMLYDNGRARYGDRLRPGHLPRADRVRPQHDHRPLLLRATPPAREDIPRPVYGTGPEVIARVSRDNPADLLAATELRPGELAIYVNYPGRDNYNFDAQDQSFAWLAARRGVAVDLICVPRACHNLSYIEGAEPPAYQWLGRHILPPAPR